MIQNASTMPKRYFGLHMEPGVAEYKEPGKDPYRIFLNENTIKSMDPTFEGKPVYVGHVNDVDLSSLENQMAGVVVRSFFNKSDGKHWVEFMVTSDRGHEAISKGWKLSNAYQVQDTVGGGQWHAVDYKAEVKRGVYNHLAIVPDPRYESSIILTPEEFKIYNSQKELELQSLANSKTKGDTSMLSFFKRTKIENAQDFESTSVVLPNSKKEFTISQLVNEMDKIQNMQGYANGDHMVKVGEEEMSVNELVEKHMKMKEDMEKNASDAADKDAKDAEKKGEGELDVDKKNKEDAAAKEDEKKKDDELKANAKNKEQEEQDEKKKFFNMLKNASEKGVQPKSVSIASDQVEIGKQKYGSGK